MKIKTEVRGGDNVARRLKEIQEKLTKKRVLVGLPAGLGNYEDGTPIVVIGAVQEFGAKMNHPGGTSYGYKTEQDAINGKVKFLKKGQGYMELGVTGPHVIDVPERSFLRVPLRQKSKEISKDFRILSARVINDEITVNSMLEQIGFKAVRYCQDAIKAGINPPNAASTIRQKGSAKPLIDSGELVGSITHVIEG